MPRASPRQLPLSTLLRLLSSHPSLSPAIHGTLLKSSSLSSLIPIPATALLTSYANAGLPGAASRLFDEMPARDAVAWNALLACLVRHARPHAAVGAFCGMAAAGFPPTAATLCTMLKACAVSRALLPGRQVHARSVVSCHGDVIMVTALVDLYMSCGLFEDAMGVFARTECPKDAALYNAVLSGCVENGRFREAFSMLRRTELNGISLTCALTACSATANLAYGMQVHCKALRCGFDSDTIMCNALIDMYAKCGRTMVARIVFDRMAGRTVVSWSSMIDVYCRHGHGEEALDLFKLMEKAAPMVLPNAITFLAVLSACGHCGLVDEGRSMLHLMKSKYGIDPQPEHYACLIDMLGRAGQIDEAWDLYCSLTSSRNGHSSAIYVAMLNACRANMDVVRGKKVAVRMLEVDPQNPGIHVLISNFHAAIRQWSESDESRRVIMDKGLRKEAASSCVSVG
ncbi:pentatricopeptide repeat-containing protein At5g66500, mitochondrial-like [Phragmites australis]|uniref:pentatricopeptide repeat-containing protein At5g66500, mitochondrial-like n=1 Tax=Phragmites australis TaxID=29695 RepID=UPI002D78DA41|nr:pentatricopeptide repeat-containing protein At5g66500, mitochondrial-like [Phragmites australis]XP_062220470.1 pentatricopeptide repeat-containing protein At5g66500, mitochondrial-like [Phragmites australis]